ncbi:cysteine hydrolase family protein [Metabacillus sp. RGM 3146]|uniref:cysteine hydrolase family protein n=1 Tax=Metabacillus sp. RGM 3146 TaxID=3401092 RepID=UPI003B9A45D4
MGTNAALLVMDLQNGIVSRYAEQPEILTSFQKAAKAARKANIPVIFVRVAFREGYPEVPAQNKMFSAISKNGRMTETEWATEIHEALERQPNEPLVTKRRVSAFSGSDLEIVLRGLKVNELILTGIATSGVVLSTLREAADKDYSLKILSDACLDGDPEVHRVLTEKVFPRQSEVLTVEEWTASL